MKGREKMKIIDNVFAKEKEIKNVQDPVSISIINAVGSIDNENIGDLTKKGIAVILNTENIEKNSEQLHLLHFCEGLACGVNGSFSKISSKTYIVAPQNFNVKNLIETYD